MIYAERFSEHTVSSRLYFGSLVTSFYNQRVLQQMLVKQAQKGKSFCPPLYWDLM